MGQYYRPILTSAKGFERVYNRDVDGEYTMAKLMEHSWWKNAFVATLCRKLLRNPMKVVWVGDYADSANTTNGIEKEELTRLCIKAWKGKGIGLKWDPLYLDELFLVNHTKKIYINCDDYYNNCVNDGWCIHPLPLLTVIGNGLGGGDYHGDSPDVGTWANDVISIERNAPDGYEEVEYIFKEEW